MVGIDRSASGLERTRFSGICRRRIVRPHTKLAPDLMPPTRVGGLIFKLQLLRASTISAALP